MKICILHHYVDYNRFKSNRLRLKPGMKIPTNTVNNYGMKLITNYGSSDE